MCRARQNGVFVPLCTGKHAYTFFRNIRACGLTNALTIEHFNSQKYSKT